ncbi:hypothetical protein [Oceanispirochaeta sp.]|jgi:hypothetical protein|uniref:hypothetical protein n=1 Tax=Oceanispirochaeta sp. TaxID=2035350 RepID=UPI002610B4D7|nr:hypothetical protein [Oceanispirochaeta sp.]MDA3956938.1 hypothetical protein [Oceanispirochaeta sp.]
MEEKREFQGKKIIFVHPPEIVGSLLLNILVDKEYEVYILQDFRRIPDIQEHYPDSIFFLNIDTAQTEYEWQEFIRNLNERCSGIQLGILSFNINTKDKMQLYLLDLGVSCGFIQLKLGVAAATEMMLKVLDVNEVRGRRKFIRYQCTNEVRSTLSFDLMGTRVTGDIQDISSVGLSCILDNHQGNLVPNQLIRNIQFRLGVLIVNMDAILLGTRIIEGERTIFVFLFKLDSSDKMKTKVRSFIYNSLQKNFNKEFSLKY